MKTFSNENINLTFTKIMAFRKAERKEVLKYFGKVFWESLGEDNKKLYFSECGNPEKYNGTTAPNNLFLVLSQLDPSPLRRAMLTDIGAACWHDLSEKHRTAYVKAYVNPESFEEKNDELAEFYDAIYEAGMSRQENRYRE